MATEQMSRETILEVKNLVTTFQTEGGGEVSAVDGVSFTLQRGQTLGLVGESGCGKSVTSLSIMRLLPRPAGRIATGSILFRGKNIVAMPPSDLHNIRGNRISMIFQEPMTALNPLHTVERQLGEVFELHNPTMTKGERHKACLNLLERVAIPAPLQRLREYPHQLSGGMRQRVMIAMALACKPDILIADEPTTALDVTIQAQILELIKELQRETGMGLIFITHALGVIAQLCDNVIVMYAGRIAEQAPITTLFRQPRHPYTRGLLESIPRLSGARKTKLPTIEGMVPSLGEFPPGCRFQNRCPFVAPACTSTAPEPELVADDHHVACLRWREVR